MRPLVLTATTGGILAFIRRTEFPLSVYCRSAARVWPMVREQVNRRISRFGVPVHEINIYRRYTTEMLKAFRTKTGEPLSARLTNVFRCSKMQSMSAQSRPALTGMELIIMSPELPRPQAA